MFLQDARLTLCDRATHQKAIADFCEGAIVFALLNVIIPIIL